MGAEKTSSRGKPVLKIFGALAMSLLVLELVLRAILGSATLSLEHPSIEYMFAPNQDNTRFGNRIFINEYGMRSPPLAREKGDNEVRVMVLGDSVINGGNHTDQEELATSLVRSELEESSHRDIQVMNISAGSWGPPNLLAYLNTMGTFQSDLAVIVLNTADYADLPTFAPLNPRTHPTVAPLLSIQEAWSRYLPILLRRFKTSLPVEPLPPTMEAQRGSLLALDELLQILRIKQIPTMLLLHASRAEIKNDRYQEEAALLRAVARKTKVKVVEDLPALKQAEAEGLKVFYDGIHPTAAGQVVLASLMLTYLNSEAPFASQ